MLSLRHHGFTLVEVMITLALTAVLVALSYPSYTEQSRKSRRVDAVSRLAALQQSQEHWRASHNNFGSLEDVGIAARSANSAYRLSVASTSRDGYLAIAEGVGSQADDTPCRYLRLTLSEGNFSRSSGRDENSSNDPAANSRCWVR